MHSRPANGLSWAGRGKAGFGRRCRLSRRSTGPKGCGSCRPRPSHSLTRRQTSVSYKGGRGTTPFGPSERVNRHSSTKVALTSIFALTLTLERDPYFNADLWHEHAREIAKYVRVQTRATDCLVVLRVRKSPAAYDAVSFFRMLPGDLAPQPAQ